MNVCFERTKKMKKGFPALIEAEERLKGVERLVTHAGVFHADEVYSTALLWFLAGREIPVERVLEVSPEMHEDERVLAYDIGGGKYDHHQANPLRNNKTNEPYCAFTLLMNEFNCWDKYGLDDLAKGIELLDNGNLMLAYDLNVSQSNIPYWVAEQNPAWNESDLDADIYFMRAVQIAYYLLEGRIREEYSRIGISDVVREAEIIDKNIMVLSQWVPWRRVRIPFEVSCVISPSSRGGWQVQSCRDGENRKIDFPEDAMEMEGVTFVHPGKFLACTVTRENAIALALKSTRRVYGSREWSVPPEYIDEW